MGASRRYAGRSHQRRRVDVTMSPTLNDAIPQRHRSRFQLLALCVGILIFACILICGATIFLYPRLGGVWASLKVLPNPPHSELIFAQVTSTSTDLYERQIAFFYVRMPLLDSRNWFAQHISMLPLDGNLNEPTSSYRSIYAGTDGHNEYLFLRLTAALSLSPTYWDGIVTCFSAEVFTQDAFQSSIYMDQYFSNPDTQNRLSYLSKNDADTIAVVTRCWPAD